MVEYTKVNKDPIEVEYVQRDGVDELVPSFVWCNRRYYLDDFIRTHNNPWTEGSDFPAHIHGYEVDSYFYPLFIELVGDEAVNVYREA